MTPEEIKKKMEEMGIPTGRWAETVDGEVRSPLLERQKKSLQQMQALLEEQVRRDQQAIANLHVALQRAKHGGGS